MMNEKLGSGNMKTSPFDNKVSFMNLKEISALRAHLKMAMVAQMDDILAPAYQGKGLDKHSTSKAMLDLFLAMGVADKNLTDAMVGLDDNSIRAAVPMPFLLNVLYMVAVMEMPPDEEIRAAMGNLPPHEKDLMDLLLDTREGILDALNRSIEKPSFAPNELN